ncbi:MAG TPA: MFS transporter [Methanocellaceae archaeon]
MSLPKLHIPEYDHRLWILFFGMGLNQFGMSIVMPFISIYLYYYQGISAALVGFAIFFSSFIGAIFQLVGGELCDRIGRRSTFVIGLVTLIASFLLLAWAVSTKAPYTDYLLILSMTRVATGLFRPIPNIIAADIVPPGKRLEAFALLRIGQNAGFALGPMVGGVMALLSYSSMFYFTAATSTVYLIIILLFIKDTRTCAPKNKFTLGDIGNITKDRAFVAFCLLTLFVSVVYSQMYTPLSVYAKGFAGLSEPEIGMLFAVNGIMVVLMQFVVTRVMDRYSLTGSMGIGVLLYAIGFGLVAFSNSFLMLGLCVFIVTLGELSYMPPNTTLTANMSTEQNRGRYQGFNGLLNTLGFAIGPLLGGILIDWLGSATWLIVMASGVLGAIAFLYLKKLVPDEKNNIAL